MLFLTFTNGILIDASLAKAMGRLGNVLPAISVEGFEEQTDARRGAGVHAKAMRAMSLLKANGVIYGISVTFTRENISYAGEFKELTEPDWRLQIEDPNFRWYQESEEYKLLFRFKEQIP